MEFLKRVLNAQLLVVLLAGVSATALRMSDLIPPEIWKDVVNTAVYLFVGGGLLKEGITSFSKKDSE
jgi:hypothetical protein